MMINNKNKDEKFKSDKWLYYQDVKVLKTKITLTEEQKMAIKDFHDFIDNKEKEDAFKRQVSEQVLKHRN